jgi:hypothetical protein
MPVISVPGMQLDVLKMSRASHAVVITNLYSASMRRYLLIATLPYTRTSSIFSRSYNVTLHNPGTGSRLSNV